MKTTHNEKRPPSTTRRGFLKTAATTAGAFTFPSIVPASVLGANAPSKRINIGLIGCGHQSQRTVPSFLVHEDMQMVAVCDVRKSGVGYYYPDQVLGWETAQRWVNEHYAKQGDSGKFKGCDAYSDYRELLARPDIDAVAIVVPDHWHALIAIDAMKAGKDVYCEKPLGLTVYEGRQMVEATRKYNRVFQTGAQFRSSPNQRRACELVRNGRLGKINLIRTWVAPNSFPGPAAGWQPMPIPEDFNYDLWLGPAPKVPYHIERCFYRWRYILDYCQGQATNYGAHTNDIAQWGLGMDGTAPVEYEDAGSEWPPEGGLFTTATKTSFRARYANGAELICQTRKSAGARFEGADGWLEIPLGGKLTASSKDIEDSVIGPDEIHLPKANPSRGETLRMHIDEDHVRNFLDAVKSRKDPIETVEIGHSTATLCILGNIAQILKRRFTWDPKTERSPDEDVNKLLSRPMRAPWELPEIS